MTDKKPKKTKTFPIHLEEDLHKKIKIHAATRDESMHGMILRYIQAGLEKEL